LSLIQKDMKGDLGGVACIRDTRIAVWEVVRLWRMNLLDKDVFKQYPELTKEDLEAAWQYYLKHSSEILGEIQKRKEG